MNCDITMFNNHVQDFWENGCVTLESANNKSSNEVPTYYLGLQTQEGRKVIDLYDISNITQMFFVGETLRLEPIKRDNQDYCLSLSRKNSDKSLGSLLGLIQTKKTQKVVGNEPVNLPSIKQDENTYSAPILIPIYSSSPSTLASAVPTLLEEELKKPVTAPTLKNRTKQNSTLVLKRRVTKRKKYGEEDGDDDSDYQEHDSRKSVKKRDEKIPSEIESNFNSEDESLQIRETRSQKKRRTRSNKSLERGFVNTGNTCFINAVLIALFHLPKFVQGLTQESLYEEIDDLLGKQKTSVFLALAKVLGKFQVNRSRIATNPESVKSRLSIVRDIFKGNDQQDAHEFLVLLLDRVKEEIINLQASFMKPYINPVLQHLTGKEYFTFTCVQCGHQSTKFQDFTDLSLHLEDDEHGTEENKETDAKELPAPRFNIQQLLNKTYENDEIIECKCENCNYNKVRCKRRIQQLPNVLILHLARFESRDTNGTGYVKKVERIGIDDTINTYRCVTVGIPGRRYSISGVVSHEGSTPRQGHYYAAVNYPEKQTWIDCDDEDINEITKDEILLSPERQSTCYILFYTIIE
jgi:ubiquitin C-terminal hydrolase